MGKFTYLSRITQPRKVFNPSVLNSSWPLLTDNYRWSWEQDHDSIDAKISYSLASNCVNVTAVTQAYPQARQEPAQPPAWLVLLNANWFSLMHRSGGGNLIRQLVLFYSDIKSVVTDVKMCTPAYVSKYFELKAWKDAVRNLIPDIPININWAGYTIVIGLAVGPLLTLPVIHMDNWTGLMSPANLCCTNHDWDFQLFNRVSANA